MTEESRQLQDYVARRRGRNGALRAPATVVLALAAAAVAVPAAVSAQDAPDPGRDEMTRAARAHLELEEARDAFHAELARSHEDQARERARAAFEEEAAAILAEHELTREGYESFILAVSLDAEARAAWEAILQELRPDGVDPAG